MGTTSYIPNEIFEDLMVIEKAPHRAFAYAYYYYIVHLYQYCKYQGDRKNTQSEIKEFLGYSPIQKGLDYIIKKDGILDYIGYTLTTTNYPVRSWFEDKLMKFETIKEIREQSTLPIPSDKNFKIKYPLKCFHRTDESEKEREIDGTFFRIENTHWIEFSKFEYMMKSEELGTIAFYIYGYLKHKCDIYKQGYQVSIDRLKEELQISIPTILKYTKSLEQHGLLNIEHQIFKLGESVESNIYLAK